MLRQRGLIPEAVRVGRYYLLPADHLEAIKARLTEQGHIAPKAEAMNASR